jgi:L-2-hydroxyglutarate oxidase LhgO
VAPRAVALAMTTQPLDAEVAVIGAGAVGLAVAQRLARRRSVVVIERHENYGRETSSHNSQVVHGGMFYPTGSLKHLLCIEGNRLLHDWADSHGVTMLRGGKLIVAVEDGEVPGLDAVMAQADANDVPGMVRLSGTQVRSLEPAVPAVAGLLSEKTGVVDAIGYVRSLEAAAREAGALFAYRHELGEVERIEGGFRLALVDADGERSELRCAALVNSAGHGAPALASTLGYPLDGSGDGESGVPRLRQGVNRGRYYDIVGGPIAGKISRPVYPVPPSGGDMPEHMRTAGGLGTHITVDTDGVVRLGPDTEWLTDDATLDYRADDERRAEFLAAGRRLLPQLQDADIAPGQVGYRPKLQRAGEEPADFLVWHDRGYVHLGGIESPGLTASLAIAGRVDEALT